MKTPSLAISLKNQLLVATPKLDDPLFSETVMYICEHTEQGAMGIAINRPTTMTLTDFFNQLNIKLPKSSHAKDPILSGGPMQSDRGFVLHRGSSSQWQSSMSVTDDIQLTTSRDIISALADDHGPEETLIALGYSGWLPGQLESELFDNCWLAVPATPDILFSAPYSSRRDKAAATLGIDIHLLSPYSGNA